MKQRTEQEIKDFFANFGGDSKYYKFEVDDVRISPDEYYVEFGQMYDAPDWNFDKLIEVAIFFGTTNINVSDIHHGGCETCDYGSFYGYELTIREHTDNSPVVRQILGLSNE